MKSLMILASCAVLVGVIWVSGCERSNDGTNETKVQRCNEDGVRCTRAFITENR